MRWESCYIVVDDVYSIEMRPCLLLICTVVAVRVLARLATLSLISDS
jgi:hypothetical protein